MWKCFPNIDWTLQVRALVSASPSVLFDLRALVREKLMLYLRARPEWLPTTRTEARPAPAPKPVEVPAAAVLPEPPRS